MSFKVTENGIVILSWLEMLFMDSDSQYSVATWSENNFASQTLWELLKNEDVLLLIDRRFRLQSMSLDSIIPEDLGWKILEVESHTFQADTEMCGTKEQKGYNKEALPWDHISSELNTILEGSRWMRGVSRLTCLCKVNKISKHKYMFSILYIIA